MNESKQQTGKTGIVKIFSRSIISVLIMLGFVFLLAGRLDYWQGWLFVAAMTIFLIVSTYLFRNKQELAQERMKPGEGVKGWDQIVFRLFAFSMYAVIIVGVLDSGRFHWTSAFPLWGYVASYFFFAFSIAMFFWPMMTNRWFSSMVRIQKDREHQVCQDGPYKFVRHPGYFGAIIMSFSAGLVFGSYMSLIPGTIAAVFMILRTYLEDVTLKNELPGYKEYAGKVKYRLVPGIW